MLKGRIRNPGAEDVVALIDAESKLIPVLSVAYQLTVVRDERLHLLVLGESDDPPEWYVLAPTYDSKRINV